MEPKFYTPLDIYQETRYKSPGNANPSTMGSEVLLRQPY